MDICTFLNEHLQEVNEWLNYFLFEYACRFWRRVHNTEVLFAFGMIQNRFIGQSFFFLRLYEILDSIYNLIFREESLMDVP